jgi:hypothetical protein
MAKQYDLETQSWIGEDDPPIDVNVLREDILKFWSETMKDDELPLSTRRGIAKDAAPYLLARLAVVATGNANDLADRLMRALQASNKVMNSQSRQVIEHEATPIDASPIEPPDHSAPFASDLKSRFRRI